MKKIAFFRLNKSSPLANENVLCEFIKQFNEYEVCDLSIKDMIKQDYLLILINLFHVARIYGIKSFFSKHALGHYFYLTPYLFKKIKEYCERIIKKDHYVFSFQMQSMFDASHPSIPNFVYTDHTHLTNIGYPDFNPGTFVSFEHFQKEKSIYHNATLVFTRSKHVTDFLIHQYWIAEKKIKCVYAGYNFPASEINASQKKYDNKNILFVGINWERKGGEDLIKAFDEVLKIYPEASLTIVGSNPGIQHPNIHIPGKIKLHEMGNYYFNAQVFCLPTRIEPFGIAFLEAMAHKLPVIGTHIGAIPDFIEQGVNGYCIKPGDITQLSGYLIELLSDPEKCRQFGEKGYEKVRISYNWETVVKKIKDHILNALISNSP